MTTTNGQVHVQTVTPITKEMHTQTMDEVKIYGASAEETLNNLHERLSEIIEKEHRQDMEIKHRSNGTDQRQCDEAMQADRAKIGILEDDLKTRGEEILKLEISLVKTKHQRDLMEAANKALMEENDTLKK